MKVAFGWCGAEGSETFNVTRSAIVANCPACSSKYAARLLAENPIPYRLGERLDLTNDNRRYKYKSVYPIIDASIPVDPAQPAANIRGWVVVKNGFGQSWEVHAWKETGTWGQFNHGEDPLPVMAPDSVQFCRDCWSIVHPHSFHSKEAALLEVPNLIGQGVLPTFAEQYQKGKDEIAKFRQSREEDDRRRRERLEQEARQAAERSDKLALVSEQLPKILNNKTLRSAEREALFAAGVLLGIELVNPAEQTPVDSPA